MVSYHSGLWRSRFDGTMYSKLKQWYFIATLNDLKRWNIAVRLTFEMIVQMEVHCRIGDNFTAKFVYFIVSFEKVHR